MMFDTYGNIFDLASCGDNCARWIQKASKEQDITVYMPIWMEFIDDEYFCIQDVGTGATAHTNAELYDIWGGYYDRHS